MGRGRSGVKQKATPENLAHELYDQGNSKEFQQLKRLVSEAKKAALAGDADALQYDNYWIIDRDGTEHFIFERDNDLEDIRSMKLKDIAYIRYANGDGWNDSNGANESHPMFKNDDDSSAQQAYENEIARIYKTRGGVDTNG